VLRDSFVAQGAVVKRAYTVEGEMASESFNAMINKFRELLQKADATVAELKSRLLAEAEVCEWTEDDDANWWTACDNGFVFMDGGPMDNDMKFCPYCGRTVTIKSEVCTDCNGTGVIHHPDYPTCQTCNGAGLTIKSGEKS
jgi:hypothetical protein